MTIASRGIKAIKKYFNDKKNENNQTPGRDGRSGNQSQYSGKSKNIKRSELGGQQKGGSDDNYEEDEAEQEEAK